MLHFRRLIHTDLELLKPWIIVRRSLKVDHWSVIEKKKTPKDRALKHFDDFYKTVYGDKLWRSVRLGLLCPNKYFAVVNNYGDCDATRRKLQNFGAMNIRELLEIQKEVDEKRKRKMAKALEDGENVENINYSKLDEKLSAFIAEKENTSTEVAMKYEKCENPDAHLLQTGPIDGDEEGDEVVVEETTDDYIEKYSLEESFKDAAIDESRIILPGDHITAAGLYEFVPTNKIMGMEGYVMETEYYEYYKSNMDFPITVEEDDVDFKVPPNMDVYTYEKCNVSGFPEPRRGNAGVFDYFLLDGASVLPVLALDLQPGDCLLDMCAAPGGKMFTALQSLYLKKIAANDCSPSRVNKIKNVLNSYVSHESKWGKEISLFQEDARNLNQFNAYNKILVDVPCTNDRVAVRENEGNIFHPMYVKERLKIPETQAEILVSALKLVKPGGTVVYSTCTLSPIQNDGIIQMALKKMWEETNHDIVVKRIENSLRAVKMLYFVGIDVGMKYGMIVLPHLTSNCGPMYVSKLVKKK